MTTIDCPSIARSCALLICKWWLDGSFLFEAVKGQVQMATGWWYLRQMAVVMRHLRGKKILMFRSALWPRTLPITSYQAKKSWNLLCEYWAKWRLVSIPLKADSHIACRAHAAPMPFPCRAAKGFECVFPIWFTQCGRVWFTLAMPRPCHAMTMPFFSRPRHSTAVERRPVGYLPAFGFFRLPRGVPRRLLSEAYQSSSQRSIPTTVKCGISTLQKRTIC